MPEITDLLDMEFDDAELEPTILPLEARLSLRGDVVEFKRIFDRLTAVTPTKEKIPGTASVHVKALDGVVTFTATDGSQTLQLETSKIRINREGAALLPGHKIKAILLLAPEPVISFTILANTVTIQSGRATWNPAIPAGDRTAPLPNIDDIQTVEVPRRAFFKALQSARRALPSLGSRKSLEQVSVAAGAITASDGYRLIRQRVDGFPKELNFCIPKSTVEELMRSLNGAGQEHIQLGASSEHIVVRDAGETLVSSQLTLDFPDLDPLLLTPALENKNSLIVDAYELRDVIARVRISADPEFASVTLHTAKTKTGEWELTVLARDRSGNSAYESMAAIWEGDDDPQEIVVSHVYLSDMLESFRSRLATIKVGSGTKTRQTPLLLHDKETGYTAVVQQSLSR